MFFNIGGGVARNIFSSPKAYIRGGDVYHYEFTCCVLKARVWGSHLPKHSHF